MLSLLTTTIYFVYRAICKKYKLRMFLLNRANVFCQLLAKAVIHCQFALSTSNSKNVWSMLRQQAFAMTGWAHCKCQVSFFRIEDWHSTRSCCNNSTGTFGGTGFKLGGATTTTTTGIKIFLVS